MKTLTMMLLMASLVFATTFDLVYMETHVEKNPSESVLAGACYDDAAQELELVNYYGSTGAIWSYSPSLGYGTGIIYLDTVNQHPFGVACGTSLMNEYYTNDWQDAHTYIYTGSYWYDTVTYTGTTGRGMDVSSDGYIWETNGTGMLVRYEDGVIPGNPTNWGIPQVTGEPSGLTCFIYGGSEYIAVAQYYAPDNQIAIYKYTGTPPLQFQCFADFPVSGVSVVRGLAYSPERNTMFLVYQRNSDGYWVVIEAYLQDTSALERQTWGGIKAVF